MFCYKKPTLITKQGWEKIASNNAVKHFYLQKKL